MGLAFLFFKFLLLQCLTPNLPHSRSHAVLGSLASLPTAGLLPLLVGPIKSHCLTRRKTKRASEEVIPPKQQWVTEQAPACTWGQGARQGSRTAKPGGKLRLEMIVKFLEVTWAEVVMFPASTDRGPHLWTIQILWQILCCWKDLEHCCILLFLFFQGILTGLFTEVLGVL